MTTDELVGLLREAKHYVAAFGPLSCPEPCPSCENAEKDLARINAALAEYDKQKKEDDELWFTDKVTRAQLGVAHLVISRTGPARWNWNVSFSDRKGPGGLYVSKNGYSSSEEDAKVAAMKVAKENRR
jgi:hypothetical protein